MPKNKTQIIASFRQRAARCEERAQHVDNPIVRASIQRAAATWTKFADELTAELEHALADIADSVERSSWNVSRGSELD